jgi:GH15 family glucan-1,4-alpha-glucosidase
VGSGRSMATTPATSTQRRVDGFLRIGEYAPIGDGHTVALVGSDGAIDWLCLPTFSDKSVFGAMLDPQRGGRFTLEPAVPYSAEREYVEGTNVLQTTFATADGAVRVTDAMSLGAVGLLEGTQVVRRIEGVAGEVPLRWTVEPRFGYGGERTTIEHRSGVPVARSGRQLLAIQAFDAGEPVVEDARVAAEATLRDGDRALLALTSAYDAPVLMHERATLEGRLDKTVDLWRSWIANCSYDGPWREQVHRSLLALKLLVYEPTGAIIAAPTTSLPERVGGSRNFDYRFAWIRDMSFAVDAVLKTGIAEQAHRSFTWLLGATGTTHPRLQPIYRIGGEPPSGQEQLDLAGYRFSQPVHSGNGASSQTQLGNYGDLFATTWLYVTSGGALDGKTGLRLAQIADLVCDLWHVPDAGIWELGDHRNYTQSKLACWLVLDRALRLAERGELPGVNRSRWSRERDAIRSYVMTRCWSDRRGTFERDAESAELDCGTLLASRMEFVAPAAREITGTIDAIRHGLGAGGPLLYRYSGMQDEEGAFVACSFWMAEALARAGRDDDAAEVIEGMLGYANDVGLFSEEIDPTTGELRGNFPQGLSHQSLLNACASLSEP